MLGDHHVGWWSRWRTSRTCKSFIADKTVAVTEAAAAAVAALLRLQELTLNGLTGACAAAAIGAAGARTLTRLELSPPATELLVEHS